MNELSRLCEIWGHEYTEWTPALMPESLITSGADSVGNERSCICGAAEYLFIESWHK